MKTYLAIGLLLYVLQASDCATAGSVQDSGVTAAKREVDAAPAPAASPVRMRDISPASFPAAEWEEVHENNVLMTSKGKKLPKRPGVK